MPQVLEPFQILEQQVRQLIFVFSSCLSSMLSKYNLVFEMLCDSMKEVQQVVPEQQCVWDIQLSFLYALNIGNMQFHLHKIHTPFLWKSITGEDLAG